MKRQWGTQWVQIGLMTSIYLPIAAAFVARVAWWEYTRDLPSIDELAHYAPAEVTVLYDRKGALLGELFEERRYVLPIEEIPAVVQDAFIAAEDGSFRSHGGIDYFGVLRALLHNIDEDRAAQGASTITQQVVKNLVLHDNAKTLERKLKEAALAWRVESTYDKDQILALYLNSIYLGAQSYGVEAAARSYFGKHVSEMSLSEAALIAGLPQRPSDYNPYRNLPRARARQAYVLRQMVDRGMVTQQQADAAQAAEIVLQPPTNAFLDNAPHFTEHVRRLLVAQLGEEVVHRGGLRVTTTCDLALQQAAQQAVHDRVTALDRESGFRRVGRVTLSPEEIRPWRMSHTEAALEIDHVYEAVVLSVASDQALVAVGTHELLLSIHDHGWISPRHRNTSFQEKIATAEARHEYYEWLDDQRELMEAAAAARLAAGLDEALTPQTMASREAPGEPLLVEGDLVEITIYEGKTGRARDGRRLPLALLHQPREPEGALLSMDLPSGAVRALVGGADFEGSQFNRAIQARRQVGSTFKPFVYGAAIESKAYTAATVVSDDAVSIKLARDKYWTPRNYGRDTMAPMTLATAMALSRNLVLVRTLIGLDEWMDDDVVYRFARKLGLGGPPTGSLPQGWTSSPQTQYLCPWTPELRSAQYCRDHQPPFPAGEGLDMKAHRRSLSKDNDHLCRSCDYSLGLGSSSLTLAEMVRAYGVFGTQGKLVEPYYIEEVRDRDGNLLLQAEPVSAQVLDPAVAYILNFMLRGVVSRGTARDARVLGLPVAGKTGTTDEGRDAWFIGMTPDLITGVWVGFDQPQTIAERATGGKVALPIFTQYMTAALDLGVVERDHVWPTPDLSLVTLANIDEQTGGRWRHGGRQYPFLPGTEPPFITSKPTEQLSVEILNIE